MKSDLIERQAAIDALDVLCQEHRYKIPGKRETYSEYNEAWQDALDRAEGAIFNLPSAQPDLSSYSDKLWRAAYERGKAEAQPQRMQGRWVEHKWAEEVAGMLISNYACSCCSSWERINSDFCPNCGANMQT